MNLELQLVNEWITDLWEQLDKEQTEAVKSWFVRRFETLDTLRQEVRARDED